jgi:putative transposase
MGLRGRSRFGAEGLVFFVTTTVVHFGKIFALGEQYYRILLDSLKFELNQHRATLIAYVFMPSHIHLVIAMPVNEHISDLMRDFKKFTSTAIRKELEDNGEQVWLDRLRRNAVGRKNQVFKLWMDRFDDLVIDNDDTLRRKINYIHENPLRSGLVERVEDWKYSSARNYLMNDHSIIRVSTEW